MSDNPVLPALFPDASDDDSDGGLEGHAEREGDQHDGDNEGQQNRLLGDGREARADRIAFNEFLRLVAGNRFRQDRAPQDNKTLLDALKSANVIVTDGVYQALLACPRGGFVPPRHRHEAYNDSPIRVDEMGFNVSAPHMHATTLEALKISRGERVLDVGCGCGIVAAAAAFLVGKEGEVVGVDVRPACVELCRANLQRLSHSSPEYSGTACEVLWEQHNAFLPAARHTGRYDKVHVGGNCPSSRISRLLPLLRPQGGVLVVPSGNELLLITRKGDHLEQRVLSQVRFSELEVPSDAEIVLAAMQQEVQVKAAVEVPPPTPLVHLPDIAPTKGLGHPPASAEASTRSSACSKGGAGASVQKTTALEQEGLGEGRVREEESNALLGPSDCFLVGRGWRLAAHRAVLQGRCDLFRAQGGSGMRDARCCEYGVPEGMSRRVVAAMLSWAYCDADLPHGLDALQVVQLVRAATYYGAPRLRALCEQRLAAEFLAHDASPPSTPPQRAPPTEEASSVDSSDDEDDDSSMVEADGGGSGGEDGEMEDGWQAVKASGWEGGPPEGTGRSKRQNIGKRQGPGGAGGAAAAAAAAVQGGAAGAAGAAHHGGSSELPDIAMQLLSLADECGLPQLRAASLAYAVAHFSEVAATEGYSALPRHLVDAIAAELHAHYCRFSALLQQLSSAPLPPPPPRSFW